MVNFKGVDSAESVKFKSGILSDYERHSNAYYSSSRMWDDGIVKASDQRRVLGMSLVTILNAPIEDSKAGVFRM